MKTENTIFVAIRYLYYFDSHFSPTPVFNKTKILIHNINIKLLLVSSFLGLLVRIMFSRRRIKFSPIIRSLLYSIFDFLFEVCFVQLFAVFCIAYRHFAPLFADCFAVQNITVQCSSRFCTVNCSSATLFEVCFCIYIRSFVQLFPVCFRIVAHSLFLHNCSQFDPHLCLQIFLCSFGGSWFNGG